MATQGLALTPVAARTNLPLAMISSSLFAFSIWKSEVTMLIPILNIVLDGVLAGLLLVYIISIWLVN